ncbi:MAG TPA: hypothetical protein VJL07_02595 [Dehalococcoidia bacterium]|nr:hypothetical protein [Dehalococcoidia bacterium]
MSGFAQAADSAGDRVYIGKQVHYVLDSGDEVGECRPAIVLVVTDDAGYPAPTQVDLVVMTRDLLDGYGNRTGVDVKTGIYHDETRANGTWHQEHWQEKP